MISPATVRMTTCRKVKPNRMASFFSTSAGIRARIGASLSRRAIGDHSFPRGRGGGDGGTGGEGAARDGRPDRDGGDGAGDEAGTRRLLAVPRGDGAGDGDGTRRPVAVPRGDGGWIRRGRAATAGTGRAGAVPPVVPLLVPAAVRPGAENTGVSGAGGRFGAACGRGAAENVAGGTGPVAGRVGMADAGALLKAGADAERPAGADEAGRAAGWWENRAGGTPPAGAGTGVAGAGALLNTGAAVLPAGADSGAWAAGALLNAAGPTGAGAVRGRPEPGCRGGRGGRGGRGPPVGLVGPPPGAGDGPLGDGPDRGLRPRVLAALAPRLTPARVPRVLSMMTAWMICPIRPRPCRRARGPRVRCFIQPGSLMSSHSMVRHTRIEISPSLVTVTPSTSGPAGVRNTRTVASRMTAWPSWMPRHATSARHQVYASPSVCGVAWQVSASGATPSSSTSMAVRRMKVTSTTMPITNAARMSRENRIGGMFGLAGWLRIWSSAVTAPLPSTPCPAIAAVSALVKAMALPQTSRLVFAATPATTTRGAISFSPYCDCKVSREATMKPPAMTNNTKIPFATTRLVVQIACTCGLLVRSGVDSTVLPNASITGFSPVLAIQARKSLIALRIWPGMSNSPGSSSEPSPGEGGVQPGGVGPGAGDGVPGGDGDGLRTCGTPGSGTPGAGVGAGAGVGPGSAHAGLVPAVPTPRTAVPVASTRPSSSAASTRAGRGRNRPQRDRGLGRSRGVRGRVSVRWVAVCMVTSPTPRQRCRSAGTAVPG